MLLVELTVEQLIAVLASTIFISIILSNIFIGMMKLSVEIGNSAAVSLKKIIKKYIVKKRAERPFVGDSNG